MRSVSSATWTSADPVSPSARPYLPISSCFCSLVKDMAEKPSVCGSRGIPCGRLRRPYMLLSGLKPLTDKSCTEVSRLGDVAVHLRDQLLGAGEPLLAPQPGDERDPQHLAVEIRVEVDQVRL